MTAPVVGGPAPHGLAAAAAFEASIWSSLLRWMFRRPHPQPAGDLFGYDRAAAPLIWVFIAISAVEIPIVDLLLPTWTWRLIGLGVGGWALLWMLGLLATVKRHPHVVDEHGIRIRSGSTIDLPVPWELIESVEVSRRTVPSSATVQIDTTGATSVVAICISSQTNLELVFTEPVVLAIGKTKGEPMSALRFFADDPDALLARVRVAVRAMADD